MFAFHISLIIDIYNSNSSEGLLYVDIEKKKPCHFFKKKILNIFLYNKFNSVCYLKRLSFLIYEFVNFHVLDNFLSIFKNFLP